MKKYLYAIGFIWFLIIASAYSEAGNDAESDFSDPINSIELEHLRNESRAMFYHAYNSYLKFAYPADELMPLSCVGRYRNYANSRGDMDDVLGNYSLTLIDSLDTLAIFGDFEEFEKAIKLVINDVSFNKDIIVSVFESNIRILGGLLSAHVISKYIQKKFGGLIWYKNELLQMSVDLGFRLLPAFETSTGIPHGKVNLMYGMNDIRLINSRETCTACAGSMILEMAALSRLSDINIFEEKSHQVMDKLWSLRHQSTDLMGTVLNIHSGDWTQKDSSVGAGIDSYYEYLLKAYILLGEDHYYDRFLQHYNAIMKYISQRSMLVDVHMHRPSIRTKNYMDALRVFWPGVQVLNGDLKSAIETHEVFFQVVRRHNFIPEAFTSDLKVYWSQHPLRPEFLESTYFLYQATRDPYYLHVGKTVLEALQKYARVPCGYAAVSDVATGQKEDRMDSFVLSETFKYLYLLFSEPKHLGLDLNDFLFTTEAHLLPLNLATINKNGKSFLNYTNKNTPELKMCPYNDNIRSLRKNIKKNVEATTKNLELDSDVPIKIITFGSFDMNNSEHIRMLKNMGIYVWLESTGNLQFVQLPHLAKSSNYAIEGEKFMRDVLESTKIINKIHLISHVLFYDPKNNNTIIRLNASGADFVLKNVSDISSEVVFAEPEDACTICTNPEQLFGKIAIVKRGFCKFVQKAKLMESFGVKGLIIVDDQKNSSTSKSLFFTMSGDGNETVNMPTVFLYDIDAQILIKSVKFEPNLIVNITKWKITEHNTSSNEKSNVDELISLQQDLKIKIGLKDIVLSSDTNNEMITTHLDKEYFNISSKIIIYQFLKNNISYLHFDFEDKNSTHRLFSFNYISTLFIIRTNLFLKTFANDSNVDNLYNVIENFVYLFQRPEIVYKMKLLNILKALSFLSNMKQDLSFKDELFDWQMIENEDFTYETNEIRVSKIDTFNNFEIKVPEYEYLSFFIHFKEIDTSLNNFVQYLPQALKLGTDSYFAEIFPLHVEEFYRMIRFPNYIVQVMDTLRRYNSKNNHIIKDEL